MRMRVQFWDACNNNTLKIKVYIRGFIFPNAFNAALIGNDRSILIQMPAACGMAARDPRFDWGYTSEPEPYCDGRQILEHRGRVLGGSSAINGMVANRGNPKD